MIFLFFGSLAVFLSIIYFVLKKILLPTDFNKEKNNDAMKIQEFLPLAAFEDSFFLLKGQTKSVAIEVESIGYDFMTEDEQDAIEDMFINFLHSLSYPVKFYCQTRIIDNTKRMDTLKKENAEMVSKFPHLKNHSDLYIDAMSHLNEYLGQSKEKKKFIVVSYTPSAELVGFSKEEINEQIEKELFSRCDAIMAGLAPIGIRSHILSKKELITLAYTSLNREGYFYVDNINELEALSIFVSTEKNRERGFENLIEKEVRNDLQSILNICQKYPESLNDLTNDDIIKLNELFIKFGGRESNKDYDY